MIIAEIDWVSVKSVLSTLIQIATIITVIWIVFYILLENQDPQKTISWILVITLIPIAGIIFYFVVGRNWRKEKIFSRKIIADFEQLEKIKEAKIANISDQILSDDKNIAAKFGIINLLHKNNKALLTEHNRVLVLNNGAETFNAIIHAILNAKDHIHLEYYIIEDDKIGNKIRELLIKKAGEGVKIRIIYDDIGSWGLNSKFIGSLTSAGIEVFSFMPVKFYRFAFKINYRNHRKIVVVDGKIGFVGGLNIADKYISGSAETGFWRDTHLRIEGESVLSLQFVFLTDWYFVSDQFVHDDKYFPDNLINEKCLVQIAASGPDSDWASIMQTYFYSITTAKKYVYISTPYFMPNESILTALKTAAMSGVDVRIILPSKSDSFISYWGSMSYLAELLEAGIKIFMYEKGFTHSKILIADDILCSVGTANMDIRSFDQNFEISALIYNEPVTCFLKKCFFDDLGSCNQLLCDDYLKRGYLSKIKESVARVFSPLW